MSTQVISPALPAKKNIFSRWSTQGIVDYLGILSGIAFLVTFLMGGNMVSGQPDEGFQEMFDYYKNNEAIIQKSVYVRAMGFIIFIIFVSTIAHLTQKASQGRSWLSAGILLSGVSASFLMISGLVCECAAALMAGRDVSPEIIRSMDELSHIFIHLFTAPLGLFLITTSIAIFFHRIAPRWLSAVSFVNGGILVAAASCYSSKEFLHWLGVLCLMIFMLWTLVLCVVLLWKHRRQLTKAL